MHTRLLPLPIARGPKRRHDARVFRFSTNVALLGELDCLAADEMQARLVVETVCADVGVAVPKLKFHTRRSPYTGATEQPRRYLVERYGEAEVRRVEEGQSAQIAPFGAIRLGRVTTLMTIAHELGHHCVFALDAVGTPSHGKRWVGRFDEVAETIRCML